MSRRYTAQEMRDFANAIAGDLGDNDHRGVEYFYDDLIPVIEALRQAADDMEREDKREMKYEYALASNGVMYHTHYCDFRSATLTRGLGENVVRRTVGEWEEVVSDDTH